MVFKTKQNKHELLISKDPWIGHEMGALPCPALPAPIPLKGNDVTDL